MRPLFIAVVCLCSTLVPVRCLGQRSPSAEQDSLLAAYGNTLLALRDSADMVRSALDQFRRDLQPAGDRTVISRAARLNERCTALVGLLRDARPIFRAYRAPNEAGREANRAILTQTGELETALSAHCLVGLAEQGPGARADSLKAWGPYHSSRLRQALAAFHARTLSTAEALGIELSR
jgi:hypothetical protein